MPGDGLIERFGQRNQFPVSEFLTDTGGVVDQVLTRIDLAAEGCRKLRLWERDDGSMPARYIPNGSNPLGYGQCGFITDIVDATGCAGVCHGEHDSGRDMLDIASRPSPVHRAFFHYDMWTMIIHAFEVGKESMLIITRSVHQVMMRVRVYSVADWR